MSLSDAIDFLKNAVDRVGSESAAKYIFSDGFAFARSAAILACHPVDLDGTFALPADDLDKALARLGDDPTIEGAEGAMVLRKGRLRSSLTVLEADAPLVPERAEWRAVPDGLTKALGLALPFVSPEDGTWQRGVRFAEGRLVAINNRSAAEVAVPGLPAVGILSDDAVAYLAKLPEPSGWIAAGGSVTFGWPGGAWVRCQLLNYDWPDDLVDKYLGGPDEAPVAFTDEWREAVEHLSVLGDGAIRVTPTGLRGTRDHSKSRYKFETGAVKETVWASDMLKSMLAVGKAWNPDAEGPARWVGDGVRGIAMRQRSR